MNTRHPLLLSLGVVGVLVAFVLAVLFLCSGHVPEGLAADLLLAVSGATTLLCGVVLLWDLDREDEEPAAA